MTILLKKYQFFVMMAVLSGVTIGAFSLMVSEIFADEDHRDPARVESAGIWGSGLGLTLHGDERRRSSGGEPEWEGEPEAIRDSGGWRQGRGVEERQRCSGGVGCDDAEAVRGRRSPLRRTSGGSQTTLAEAIAEMLRQHGAVQTLPVGSADTSEPRSSSSRSSGGATDVPEEAEPEYASLREYLVDVDEPVSEVRDVVDILADPSNIVPGQEVVDLLAWDVREREPQGSYLYVLEQDTESRVTQVHRYFCPERRLDILAESCVPIASVYSDGGEPMSVRYTGSGQPTEGPAGDLDPSLFSPTSYYLEANELLLALQEYFNQMRS